MSLAEFRSISINDKLTFQELYDVKGDKNLLISYLGNPLDDDHYENRTVNGDIFIEGHSFDYGSAEIGYTTSTGMGFMDLKQFNITGLNFFLRIKGERVTVGYSIDDLKLKVPFTIEEDSPDGKKHVSFIINNSDFGLTFTYDPNTRKIVEIYYHIP